MTKDEALKMALEALEVIYDRAVFDYSLPADHFAAEGAQEAITVIKETLANVATEDTSKERVDEMQKQRHEQEPVAFIDEQGILRYYKPSDFNQCEYGGLVRLYKGKT